MAGKRDKVRMISSAGTGHFYTTDKNKKNTPGKMEFLKYDPVVRKHVLYKEGKIIGGLGVSGDTSCADHEVAKEVRDQLGLNPPGGKLTDDIIYPNIDGPSEFGHPLCNNTKRNGSAKLGDETKAISY